MSDYANVREIFQDFIGKRVLDITQHDKEEFQQTGKGYIMLMFEEGLMIQIQVAELDKIEDLEYGA